MSNNNNNSSSISLNWDPSRLRLDQALQGGTGQRRRTSPIKGKFIKGPIDVVWLCRASHLGVKALLVSLALWHIKGLRKSDTFIVSNLMLRDWVALPVSTTRTMLSEKTARMGGALAVALKTRRINEVSRLPARKLPFCDEHHFADPKVRLRFQPQAKTEQPSPVSPSPGRSGVRSLSEATNLKQPQAFAETWGSFFVATTG